MRLEQQQSVKQIVWLFLLLLKSTNLCRGSSSSDSGNTSLQNSYLIPVTCPLSFDSSHNHPTLFVLVNLNLLSGEH